VVKLMPETKTQRRSAAKKKGPTRKPRAAHATSAVGPTTELSVVERTTELSEDVLKLLEDGAQTGLATVRMFVDTVDKALPLDVVGLSKQREIVDAALEMTKRLLQVQYDLMRDALRSVADVDVNVGVNVDVDINPDVDVGVNVDVA
jgi:hypothetical protein